MWSPSGAESILPLLLFYSGGSYPETSEKTIQIPRRRYPLYHKNFDLTV